VFHLNVLVWEGHPDTQCRCW